MIKLYFCLRLCYVLEGKIWKYIGLRVYYSQVLHPFPLKLTFSVNFGQGLSGSVPSNSDSQELHISAVFSSWDCCISSLFVLSALDLFLEPFGRPPLLWRRVFSVIHIISLTFAGDGTFFRFIFHSITSAWFCRFKCGRPSTYLLRSSFWTTPTLNCSLML